MQLVRVGNTFHNLDHLVNCTIANKYEQPLHIKTTWACQEASGEGPSMALTIDMFQSTAQAFLTHLDRHVWKEGK